MAFLFAAAIDTSCPTDAAGNRLDQMDRSGHYALWEEDFECARQLGVTALRFGPAYYRTHTGPGRYDWESCEAPMAWLRESSMALIAELCSFGTPKWLGGFQDPAFPVLFADYARAFAKRHPWVKYFMPVTRIGACARASGLQGEWNECLASDAGYVRALRNLCMAHELAVEAILGERPDAVIIQNERIEYHHGAGQHARAEAERRNARELLAIDLTTGHELAPGLAGYLVDNGMKAHDLRFLREPRAVGQRWLGLEYTPLSERRVASSGRITTARQGFGFRRLATEYHGRYKLPLFHAGTQPATRRPVPWLREQWKQVMALRTVGVPVHGFTWLPLTDGVEMTSTPEGPRRAPDGQGLYDLVRTPRPAANVFRGLIERWSVILGARADSPVALEAGSSAQAG
jgi:beta-glucosidase/6-phospho-beta-glucosidase/beta-galactosidase